MAKILRTLILGVFLLACTSSSYATIRVGTVVFDPPYIISLNQGFEIDLLKQICSQIHQECTLITMDYNQLFSALDENRIDIAMDNIDFYISPNPLNGDYIYSALSQNLWVNN